MSEYNVLASVYDGTQVASPYGSARWEVIDPSRLGAMLGVNHGSRWGIWSVMIPSAIAGENVTNVRMVGGHDYLIGGGGVGMTRQAVLYIRHGPSVASFTSAAGTAAAGVPGSGAGQTITLDMPVTGVSSSALITGSFFVGHAVATNGGNPGEPFGQYRNGVLNWTIYTGASNPGGGGTPGQPYLTVVPGSGNTNPGMFAGTQQFASTRANWQPNGANTPYSITYTWTISGSGITFSNGTNRLSFYTLSSGGATWWYHDTGLLNISANAIPGTYTLSCEASTASHVAYISTQLVVRPRYSQLTEF